MTAVKKDSFQEWLMSKVTVENKRQLSKMTDCKSDSCQKLRFLRAKVVKSDSCQEWKSGGCQNQKFLKEIADKKEKFKKITVV